MRLFDFRFAAAAAFVAAGLTGEPVLADTPLRVNAVTVSTAQSDVVITLTGLVEAKQSFNASFPTGGEVVAVAVQAGQKVRKGDVLAELDSTQARESVRAAEAILRAGEAAYLQATQTAERERVLAKQGYASQSALDQAEEALKNAASALDQARSQLQKAQKTLTDTTVVASQDAIVTSRDVEPGQVVGAAQSIVQLAALTGREAVFIAPTDYELKDIIGREVALRTLEPPERTLTGRISYVSPVIDSGTGGVKLKAALAEDEAAKLVLKEPVEGRIALMLGKAISVPAASVTRYDSAPAVWVVGADGKVAARPVVIARYSTDRVYLQSGLEDGDVVVAEGTNLLYPGRTVDVIGGAAQ